MSQATAAKEKAQTVPLKKNVVNEIAGVVYPKNYYEFDKLDLHFKNKSDRSVDLEGSKKYQVKQNTPLDYVAQLQKDLIAIGYLPTKSYDKKDPSDDGLFGDVDARAVSRFQRHAKRLYRMTKDKNIDDVKMADIFKGREDGVCDYVTAKEIRKWIEKNWIIPVGRLKLAPIPNGGKLREDAAEEWKKIVERIVAKGGTIGNSYGNSIRELKIFHKKGTSRYSFHYVGRAIDLNQTLANPSNQRYFVGKESMGSKTGWRIFCKTDKQDGSQGAEFKKGEREHWIFPEGKSKQIPAGYYIDLTIEIESSGKFQRIPAWDGWEKSYDSTEWWHFQYTVDKQLTFQDEAELIGYSEADLWARGWNTYAMLDHPPG